MKPLWFTMLLLVTAACSVYGQTDYAYRGLVLDDNKYPLVGASVIIENLGIGDLTDGEGHFGFDQLPTNSIMVEIAFLGYQTVRDTISLDVKRNFVYHLEKSEEEIDEVVVRDNYVERKKEESFLNIEIVDETYLKQNIGGSLMKSLEKIPGVSTIDIGAGQSKPVIRGLGFNRVLVVENNIKHEAQQWGVDHGLEIDQYAVDNIEIIKGPSSLMYGSDAIGGVIDMKNRRLPAAGTFGVTVDVTGRTNNSTIGTSVMGFVRKDAFFFTARATILDYGDYRVPTDSVDIYNYRVPLYQNHVRNTAGEEQNVHTSFGVIKDRFQSKFFVSNVRSKSGFFANAHGLEPRNVDEDFHDASKRDIQYPFQKVNHFKVVNNSSIWREKWRLTFDVGFQHNFRQEWSQYVQHGHMPAVFPEELDFNPEIERQFSKFIYTGNVTLNYHLFDQTHLNFGVSNEYVKNEIGGRGFIIPAYQQYNFGVFAVGEHHFSEKSQLQVGVRYDYGNLQTETYNDWFLSPVTENGTTTHIFLARSEGVQRHFSNISWSVGYNYNPNKWSYKFNIGKSFRMPIAKELGANGVNYHRFSFEVGDVHLTPETSYQIDIGIDYNSEKFYFAASPFLNYFTNYIYLNPTPRYDRLYGFGNQVFEYTQSKVLRVGGELSLRYRFVKNFEFGFDAEYVYAQQLSGEKKGFTLPFSPPATGIFSLKYSQPKLGFIQNAYVSMDYRLALAQSRIVPPEERTEGYHLLNLGVGGEINIKKQPIILSVQLNNVINSKYFNHASYYRLINIPELGRNLVVNLSLPITGKLKQKNEN